MPISKKIKIDLHIHSHNSDGKLSPQKIISILKQKSVKLASLTDHDTIDGINTFLKTAKKHKISAVSGIEISATYKNQELHILGYNFNYKDKNLLKILKENQKNRKIRAEKSIIKLKKSGFIITNKDLTNLLKKKNPGKPHIANIVFRHKQNIILLQKKYNFKENKWKFIGAFIDKPGQIGYVKKIKINALRAIKIIKSSGGIAVLAHPLTEFKNNQKFIKTAKNLIKVGLNGIEIYNQVAIDKNIANKTNLNFYHQFCRQNNLIETFGSDDHTGELLGKIEAPYSIFENFNKKTR